MKDRNIYPVDGEVINLRLGKIIVARILIKGENVVIDMTGPGTENFAYDYSPWAPQAIRKLTR